MVSWNAKRYRGDLVFHAGDSGIVVVNRLPIESYLRGVVPLEIGTNQVADGAAVEAQAVAARSYAYARLAGGARRYDLLATVSDQVYGGADAERPLSDAAVASTAGLVLTYGGRPVSAPYSSTCGGSTAEAGEVWRSGGEPFLQRVSDRIPGTERYYCDISPRFAWTRRYTRSTLAKSLDRYLERYVAVPAGGRGRVRSVEVESRTESGRVGVLAVTTERGRYLLRGNDIRFVLRTPAGEILNSTYFSVEQEHARDGTLGGLTLRGHGYGHGIGMCQWGAIGRARAGQDYRAILRTYYPGTTVAAVD